jgi:hypothetical protein
MSLQKYAFNGFLSGHSEAMRALASLRSNSITEGRSIQPNVIREQLIQASSSTPQI